MRLISQPVMVGAGVPNPETKANLHNREQWQHLHYAVNCITPDCSAGAHLGVGIKMCVGCNWHHVRVLLATRDVLFDARYCMDCLSAGQLQECLAHHTATRASRS